MMNIQTSMTDRGALTVKGGSMLIYYMYIYYYGSVLATL
jgi:hypothetical protein